MGSLTIIDRNFIQDSLYFYMLINLVKLEDKISYLVSNYNEMSNLTGKKGNEIIPKLTDEEYNEKYIESLSHLHDEEWHLSLEGFRFLIRVNKNHELADNCQYWIAEVYYFQKDFHRSIKEFEKVFTFLGTNKSVDAQLKLGLCYINIGDIYKAKDIKFGLKTLLA